MTKKKVLFIISILLVLLAVTVSSAGAQEAEPVVHAILFYSPTCGHCEYVITQVFPSIFEEYGEQVEILLVNAYDPNDPGVYLLSNNLVEAHEIDNTVQSGQALFLAYLEEIGVPSDQTGVPFMVVSDGFMIGSQQIPDEFPGLIAQGLSGDGIAWPQYTAVQDFLTTHGFIDAEGNDLDPEPVQVFPLVQPQESPTAEPSPTDPPVEAAADPTEEPTVPPTEEPTPTEEPEIVFLDDGPAGSQHSFIERFNQDPVGNGIAVVVLLWLIGVVVYAAVQFMRAANLKLWPEWILPVLLVAGLGIAIYLASIEVSGGEAFCGPVGDCNAVQSSEYAKLFGVIPVAILGIAGYVMIGVSWLVSKKTTGQVQFYAKMGMFLFALVGLLFFVYLTFLEPFVIGATCAWCVSSAIIMSVINLFTLPVMLDAWDQLDLDEEEVEEA